ncbi:MAG TPA: Plug domain-containing protein, partial [Pseudomonadales bacterium]
MKRTACALLALAAAPCPLLADEKPAARLEELVVYGRAEQRIGSAHTASEGVVGYDDIELPPLLRVGELVEVVPGMVATQHSGTGKANQYFLRGFNLDHGTDFAAYAEGVPLNMRSHGHGQGYLDLNFLIPELVRTAAYRKGPYAADVGDFSSAGNVEFSFYDRLPETLLSLTLGEERYGRALLAGSAGVGSGVLTSALDVTRYDGPWTLEENLRQDKVYLSYAVPLGGADLKVTLQGYEGEWDATDQIPQRAVEQGLIDPLGFIDPDLGGDTQRYALTASASFTGWKLSAYAIDYDFALISNFSYFLDDPVQGDEFVQRDDRRVYGLDVGGDWLGMLGNRALTVHWGGELRYDDVKQVGLFRSVAREPVGVVRRDALDELSVGAFVEADLELTT